VSRFSRSLCLLLMVTTASTYAEMKLSIKGLSGKLAENVDARLSLITPDKVNTTPNFKRYFESETGKALRALGYYSPTFEYDETDPKVLVVTVLPGEPIRIKELNINLNGEGKEDKDFQELLTTQLPKIGDILNHVSHS